MQSLTLTGQLTRVGQIPTMGVKAAPKTSKALKDDILEQKSPAEFFADNRNIAGFDNVSILLI